MLKEAKRIPEEILGKVSIAVSYSRSSGFWEGFSGHSLGIMLVLPEEAFFVSPYALSCPDLGQEEVVCVRGEGGSVFPTTFHSSDPLRCAGWCCLLLEKIWEKLSRAVNSRSVIDVVINCKP